VALLSDQDRAVVSGHLAAITTPVTILFFTQTIDAPDTALIARQVLDEVVSLSDQISLEEVNFVLDRERAAQFGIDGIPAVALLRGGEDTRIRFLGAPAGYEFMSLIDAVILAGTGESGLTPESKALVAAHVTKPMEMLVFVTPTIITSKYGTGLEDQVNGLHHVGEEYADINGWRNNAKGAVRLVPTGNRQAVADYPKPGTPPPPATGEDVQFKSSAKDRDF